MVSPKTNYFIDVVLALSFLLVGITGIIKTQYFFALFGKGLFPYMQTISMIHDWCGILFVISAALHFILHFNWLVGMTKQLGVKKKEG